MNLVELNHALRKLRLSGMATVLEARLRQAQSEQQAPIDLISALVGDQLLRGRSPHRPAGAAGALPRWRPLARRLRFRLQQEDGSQPDPRPRDCTLHPATGRRAVPRAAWHRQESSRAGDWEGGECPGPPRPLPPLSPPPPPSHSPLSPLAHSPPRIPPPPELAHEGPHRLALRGRDAVELTRLGPVKMAGFARRRNGRF